MGEKILLSWCNTIGESGSFWAAPDRWAMRWSFWTSSQDGWLSDAPANPMPPLLHLVSYQANHEPAQAPECTSSSVYQLPCGTQGHTLRPGPQSSWQNEFPQQIISFSTQSAFEICTHQIGPWACAFKYVSPRVVSLGLVNSSMTSPTPCWQKSLVLGVFHMPSPSLTSNSLPVIDNANWKLRPLSLQWLQLVVQGLETYFFLCKLQCYLW